MRDHFLYVDDAALDQPDSFWSLVSIPILKLQIHLAGAETHKRYLYLILADSDDEDFASKLDRLNRTGHEILNAGAFYGDPRLLSAHRRNNLSRSLLRGPVLNGIRPYARDKVSCEL